MSKRPLSRHDLQRCVRLFLAPMAPVHVALGTLSPSRVWILTPALSVR